MYYDFMGPNISDYTTSTTYTKAYAWSDYKFGLRVSVQINSNERFGFCFNKREDLDLFVLVCPPNAV